MQRRTNIAKCLLAGTFLAATTLLSGTATNSAADYPAAMRSMSRAEFGAVSIGGLHLPWRESAPDLPSTVMLADISEYEHLLPAPLDEDHLDLAMPGIDPIETGAIVAGVFNTVAIPIHRFPVAKRWARIMQGIEGCVRACKVESALLDRVQRETEGKTLVEKVGIVNALVNNSIRYSSDRSLYGELDHWAGPREILTRASGDCEDFAILKMTALMRAGLPANSLSLVVLRDTNRGVFHAVLAVATSSGSFILDNTRAKVVMDSDLPNYQPLYSLSQARAWIHGTKTKGSPAVARNDDVATVTPGEGFTPGETGDLRGQRRIGIPAPQ